MIPLINKTGSVKRKPFFFFPRWKMQFHTSTLGYPDFFFFFFGEGILQTRSSPNKSFSRSSSVGLDRHKKVINQLMVIEKMLGFLKPLQKKPASYGHAQFLTESHKIKDFCHIWAGYTQTSLSALERAQNRFRVLLGDEFCSSVQTTGTYC